MHSTNLLKHCTQNPDGQRLEQFLFFEVFIHFVYNIWVQLFIDHINIGMFPRYILYPF